MIIIAWLLFFRKCFSLIFKHLLITLMMF